MLLIFSILNMHGIPLKDKKGITITDAFQKNFKESNRKSKQNMGR